MKKFSPNTLRKIFVLLIFSMSISFTSISFAQEEAGFFNWMSSFLTTSFLPKSDASRMDILFASPRKILVSQEKKEKTEIPNNIKSVSTENTLLNILRSKRILTDQDVENIKNNVVEKPIKTPSIPVKIDSLIKQNSTSSCSDSDGGINTTKKGNVKWKVGMKTKSFMDESVEDGVIEYSCEKDSLRGDFIDCEHGSKNGVCETKPLCPKVSCAAPQPGCVYKAGTFENGCENPCAEVICKEGAISISVGGHDSYIEVGDNFVEIGEFSLFAKEAVQIKSIHLENIGSAIIDQEYLQNLDIYSSENNIISDQQTSVSGNMVTFNTDGFLLSDLKKISVRADIIAGKGFDSMIQFEVKKVILSDGTVVEFSSNNILKTYRIKRGSIELSTEGALVDEEISTEVFQKTLLKGRLVAGEPVLLEELRVQYGVTGLPNAMDFDVSVFGNYQLYINGEQVNISSNPIPQSQYIVLSFSPQFMGGHSMIEIKADIDPVDSPASVMFGIDPLGVIASYARGGKEVVTKDYMSGIIDGNTFSFKNGGVANASLVADIGSVVYSDILISGQDNVDVMQIRFHAMGDEVRIKDLYLENDLNNDESPDNTDVGARLDFKLYNEAGQLLQTKQMINGELHFELNNSDRIIVPQNGSSFITIRGDLRDIINENQTGKRLKLSLDGSHNTKGIVAVTASTGNDITSPQNGWEISPGNVTGEDFVIYKSKMALNHASVQPNFGNPIAGMQEVYRFTAIADAIGEVDLGKITLNMNLIGMQSAGSQIISDDVEVHLVENNGRINPFVNVGTATVKSGSTVNNAEIIIDFNDQQLSSGELRTYTIFLGNLTNDVSMVSDDDAIVTMFKLDNNYSAPSARGNQSGYIVWSDISSSTHSDTSMDWENGYLSSVETTSMVVSD